jgi:hypothetical protein
MICFVKRRIVRGSQPAAPWRRAQPLVVPFVPQSIADAVQRQIAMAA